MCVGADVGVTRMTAISRISEILSPNDKSQLCEKSISDGGGWQEKRGSE